MIDEIWSRKYVLGYSLRMELFSNFLFATPSFAGGMGRLIDFGGTMNVFNDSLNGDQADAIALRMDMKAIARDFNEVIRKHEQGRAEDGKGQTKE